MSSRRNRAKADATRTPLADLAPSLPTRTDGESAADPEQQPEPADIRSRPGARKINDRSHVPAVPRTIAEMQAGTYPTVSVETDAPEAEERAAVAPEPTPLFVSRQTLLATTLMPFAIVALVPAILDLICRAASVSGTVRLIIGCIASATCSLIVLALLVRNWRTAFHDAPSELHPITILALWEQRASGARRDGWVTGALAIIAGFVVMLMLSLLLTVIARGASAIYAIPYFLILLFAKAVGAIVFVGYLQRGVFTFQSATRATVTTGVLYGVALAIWNACTILASDVAHPLTFILTYALISLAVALAVAWIRLRSGSLIAAVAFQLLLLLLGIAV